MGVGVCSGVEIVLMVVLTVVPVVAVVVVTVVSLLTFSSQLLDGCINSASKYRPACYILVRYFGRDFLLFQFLL